MAYSIHTAGQRGLLSLQSGLSYQLFFPLTHVLSDEYVNCYICGQAELEAQALEARRQQSQSAAEAARAAAELAAERTHLAAQRAAAQREAAAAASAVKLAAMKAQWRESSALAEVLPVLPQQYACGFSILDIAV